jgi:hypothetical protein
MIQQSQLLDILEKEYDFTMSRQAFSKKVVKGYIRAYYKKNSKRKFYKLHEVVAFFGLDKKSNNIELEHYPTLEGLLLECTSELEKVRVERAWHRAEKKRMRYEKMRKEYIHKDDVNMQLETMIADFKRGVNLIVPNLSNLFPNSDSSFLLTLEKMLVENMDKMAQLDYDKIIQLERLQYS